MLARPVAEALRALRAGDLQEIRSAHSDRHFRRAPPENIPAPCGVGVVNVQPRQHHCHHQVAAFIRVSSVGAIPQISRISVIPLRVLRTRSTFACRPLNTVFTRRRVFARFGNLSARAFRVRCIFVPITVPPLGRFIEAALPVAERCVCLERERELSGRRSSSVRGGKPRPAQELSVRYTPAARSPARFRAQLLRGRRDTRPPGCPRSLGLR